MSRTLPLLPGLSARSSQESYHKKQTLKFENDMPILASPRSAASSPRKATSAQASQPAWLLYDKQTLVFDAYFQEAVLERQDEHYRVRSCKIYYFPEDDTIEVIENKQDNSGLQQGKFLRRHRIPKPAPNEEETYTLRDFNVGREVTFYGRTFKITDCDKFTREFLTRQGTIVGESESAPFDPHSTLRQKQKETQQALRPYERQDKLKQFIDHDRHVLRFYCVWDDSGSEGGERRYMVLMYFLSDDSIEVTEVQLPNAGRDGSAVFLRRQKLPKTMMNFVQQPGSVTSRTLLNVFASNGLGGRHILDSLRAGTNEGPSYKDSDLEIGAVIDVFGRKLLLCDCDEFTKSYYKEKYGIEDFSPVVIDEKAPEPVERVIPPHNGIGTEEDSLVSVHRLVLLPPKKDFAKWFTEGAKALAFNGVFAQPEKGDEKRTFAINFYLSDDTVAIFEERKRNSGIAGGKFLERSRLKTADNTRFLTPQDFRVGVTIELNKFKFLLIDATEFTLKLMEDRSAQFPESDFVLVSDKLRSLAPPTLAAALSKEPEITLATFKQCLTDNCVGLTEQEMLTIARRLRVPSSANFVIRQQDLLDLLE